MNEGAPKLSQSNTSDKKGISRRDFLRTTGAGVAAVVVGEATPHDATAEEPTKEKIADINSRKERLVEELEYLNMPLWENIEDAVTDDLMRMLNEEAIPSELSHAELGQFQKDVALSLLELDKFAKGVEEIQIALLRGDINEAESGLVIAEERLPAVKRMVEELKKSPAYNFYYNTVLKLRDA